jgi:hypothetical protein
MERAKRQWCGRAGLTAGSFTASGCRGVMRFNPSSVLGPILLTLFLSGAA